MKLAKLDHIHISPNRQRRNFDLTKLADLGNSIRAIGLLHPIVVREEGGSLYLVSGERRLRAISDLHELGETFSHDGAAVPPYHIPYVTLGELDELAREEAELEENTQREDLGFLEQAAAVRRLALLRAKQAAAEGRAAPTVAAVAEEVRGTSVGGNQTIVRKQLIVAEHADAPEVKGAKTLDDAFKALKRREETERRTQLAAEVGKTYSAETAHRLLNEDCIAWLQAQPVGHFDVILTDPPYGIGADEFGDSGGHTGAGGLAAEHQYDDSYASWCDLMDAFIPESFRITKPEAHIYCFCDITRFDELKCRFRLAGWQVFRTPLIWHKPNGNRLPWVDSGPQRKYEIILYAKKGNKPVTRIFPDLVSYAADENLGHNAQKPVALYVDLLRRSVSAGDRILDPFAGSGPILPAATELKCQATAIELDPAAYAIGVERLKKLTEQPELEGLV